MNLITDDCNSGNRNSGYFNNIIPKIINVFNNSCDINIWDNIEKPKFIYNIILEEWVYFNNMSVEEKKLYPKAYIRDGYLKTHSYKDAWNTAYKNATTDDIILLKQLPNFDVRVFEDITGIRIK